jgi:hypothetical protein
MKNLRIVTTIIIFYLICVTSSNASDSFQNVYSISHQLNGYDNDTEIAMSWNPYTDAMNYFYTFNTTQNYTITGFDNMTSLTSIESDDLRTVVEASSKSSVAFYFHIAAFVNWNLSPTTTKGPYYIDIKPPSKVSVIAKESTVYKPEVQLSLYADDNPTEMCISVTNFGEEDQWIPYSESSTVNLKDSLYGKQTVYVLFRDALGNTTDGSSAKSKTTVNYIPNTAPDIMDLLAEKVKIISGTTLDNPDGPYTPVCPQIVFSIKDKEGGDLQVIVFSSNISASTLTYTKTISEPFSPTKTIATETIDSTGSALRKYTITDLSSDEARTLSMVIRPASESITSSIITLTVKDSGGLTDTETLTFNITEDLLVNLTKFSVTPKTDQMLIQWQTSSEIDVNGFILKRREAGSNDGFKTITDKLIQAKGSSIVGANYLFYDTEIEAGKTYNYQLVEVDFNNKEKVCTVSSDVKRSGDSSDDEIDYDANGDGDVNVGDVIYLLQQLTNFQESD